MKKGLIALLIVALVALGVFVAFNSNSGDENHNMAEANNMSGSDDMTEADDMIEADDMTEDDDMTEEDDMTEKDDMTEEDDMEESDDMMMNDGDMAEMFELKSIDGQLVKLADFKGEKVYVKFWASWCSICLAGLEDLDKLSTMDNDYKVITVVSPDYNGEKSAEKFVAWFEKQGHENLTVLLDQDGEITRKFGVRGYPTSAFIGSDGILVHMYPGHLEDDMITKTFMDIH